jgi:hypothetical protein
MSLAKLFTAFCLGCTSLLLIQACQSVASQRKPTQLNHSQASQVRWYELKDSSGDFVLFFPKKPNHEVVNRNNDLVDEYTLPYDRCWFSFEYYKIDDQLTVDGYRRMRNYMLDQTIRLHIQDGWRLLGQKVLSDDGYQMDWAVPSNGTMAYMRRQEFFRNSRAYAIGFHSYDSEDLDSKLATRFFSSLHFKDKSTAERKTNH